MNKSITLTQLEDFEKDFNRDPAKRVAQLAVTMNGVNQSATDPFTARLTVLQRLANCAIFTKYSRYGSFTSVSCGILAIRSPESSYRSRIKSSSISASVIINVQSLKPCQRDCHPGGISATARSISRESR